MKLQVDKELMEEVLQFVDAMGRQDFVFGKLTEHPEYFVLRDKIKQVVDSEKI